MNISKSINEIMALCSPKPINNIKNIIEAQAKLDFKSRREVRRSSQIASNIFNVPFQDSMLQDYYYWDNTTLSLLLPLREYVRNKNSVLEIGPSPAATLSRYLQKTYEGLHIVCAEVDPHFAISARKAVLVSGGGIEIHVSDMTSNIENKFDIVFMNPPYVSNVDLFKLDINAGTPEFQAGSGGSDGLEVVEKFLTEVPVVLKSHGAALLGINNLYFPDAEVIRLINKSNLSLIRKFYCIDSVPPFSQVYVLSKKEGST